MLGYSQLNPIYFKFNETYNHEHNSDFCYFQKWSMYDTIKIQLWADSLPTMTLVDFDTKERLTAYQGLAISTTVVAPAGMTLYELTIDSLPFFGRFQFELSMPSMTTMFLSEPFIWVEDAPETVLLSYRNSKNNFSTVFDTGIDFYFRVEGTVQLFQPKLDTVVYFDQMRNPKLLSAQPYKTWKLIAGTGLGVPDWVLNRLNYIMSCDIKQVDNLKFELAEGAAMEIQRADNYPLSSAAVDIVGRTDSTDTEIIDDIFVLGDSEENAVVINNNLIIHK